jgi:nicotinic acid mononucleotide adenylyltransferase
VAHTRYTADTLSKLVTRFPSYRFLWLMGADNLAHDGHHWLMAVLARRHKAACDLGT